jgi:hypothetical protein
MLPSPYKVIGEIEQFDERDNVQSRNTLVPGSEEYKEYYRRHPEWEEKDRETREIAFVKPGVGHPLDLPFFLQQIGSLACWGREDKVDGPVSQERQELSPERAAQKIKGFARHLGADIVRIGPLNPAFVYTHVGKTRHDSARRYGNPIRLEHKNAISIAVGLNPDMIKTGPVLSEIVEVMRVYTQLATISITIAGYIRALGYAARAHVVSNYQVLCIPVAIEAGMGELGRHGLMMTKELGSCLKITTVTTDLPLDYDRLVDRGAKEFCQDCKICAENCPGGAISHGGKKW